MSKLKLKDDVMIHYAAMLSAYCDDNYCPHCPFNNYGNGSADGLTNCLLMEQPPIYWGEILEKIRKEAKA